MITIICKLAFTHKPAPDIVCVREEKTQTNPLLVAFAVVEAKFVEDKHSGGRVCLRLEFEGYSPLWWGKAAPPVECGDKGRVRQLVTLQRPFGGLAGTGAQSFSALGPFTRPGALPGLLRTHSPGRLQSSPLLCLL